MDWDISGFPVLHHLPELAQTHVHWVSDAIHHLVLCSPLLLLPPIFPSHRGLFRPWCEELALHIRWPDYWSFSFSISPSTGYSGLISSRIGWFKLGVNSSGLSSADFSSLFLSLERWLLSVDSAWQQKEGASLFTQATSEVLQVCSDPCTLPFPYTHIPGLPASLSVLQPTGPFPPQRNSPAKNLGIFFFSLWIYHHVQSITSKTMLWIYLLFRDSLTTT